MNDRTCGNCRWWQYHRDWSGKQIGQCRQCPAGPEVYNTDFCGEWRDKSITPEQEQRAELVTRFALAIVGSDYDSAGSWWKPATIWRMAAEYVDAKPETVLATCDGCNTELPSNGQRLCPECSKTLDALSEYVKQRSEVNRER